VARWSPSFRRGRAKEARARAIAPLRYIHVAGCTLNVGRGAVRCYGRVAPSRPEQRNNVARSSEGQPFTTGMNVWPGLSRLVQVPTWRPAVLIAANADDYFRPSHRRPLLQCCRRLATPSLVAFATDQIYRSLQGRVTTATPMPEALDFMGGLTIKPS